MLSILLIALLVALLLGVLPSWPHSRDWGYFPSGSVGAVVLVVVLLALMGRI